MSCTQTILSWHEPLLPQLIARLTAGCTGKPWDLRELLVVVPTQESGRRLRQGLALAAAKAGTGVLSPSILTPEQLVRTGLPAHTASDTDGIAAWCDVLLRVPLEDVRAVLPSDPPRRDAVWAVGLAQQLASVQRVLGEHGLDFDGVAARVRGTAAEPERWAQLATLEAHWHEALADRQLVGPAAAAREHGAQAAPPAGVTRLIVAAVADPAPLCLELLQRWSQALPVEVLVHGPPDDPLFDLWGRPRTEAFASRVLAFDPHRRIQVVRDGKAAAAFACRLASAYRDEPQSLALGLIDPEAAGPLQLAFAQAGLAVHDPAGRSLAAHGLGLLARQLLRLATDARVSVAGQVLRHPLFAGFVVEGRRWFRQGADLLVAFDHLLNEHLPNDLSAAAAFARQTGAPGLASTLDWLCALQGALLRPQVARTLGDALAEIVAAAPRAAGADDDEAATGLRDLLAEASAAEAKFSAFTPEAMLATLDAALTRGRSFPPATPGAWDLQGWLELGYEAAPHLVLIGCNEGHVPETIHGDLFLPNNLREQLGLRGNRERLARDHYLFEALLAARAGGGRVDVLVPRMSDDGDPRQPSRLLFRCHEDELVARARQLFDDLPPPPPSPPRRAAWKLGARPASSLPPHFSPSAIKTYLACPFRYYLTHILRAEPVQVGQREITPQVFGNLCHLALQRLGENAELRDVEDPQVLAEFLTAEFQRNALSQFGRAAAFALRVQLESVQARLRAAAEVEAEQRRQGWRIVKCEEAWSFERHGVLFKGRIDRIDHNRETGAYRLIDYKTYDRDRTPEKIHWARCREQEPHVLPGSVFDREGQAWRWVDVQLPLYLLAMRPGYGEQVTAGYFLLPKTKEETGLRLWEDLAPTHLEHAEACALAVAEAVRGGRFWPAAEKLGFEHPTDYLFPDGIEANVEARLIEALAEGVVGA